MSARMSVEQSVDHLFLTRGSSPTEPSLDPRIAHTLVPPVCIATVDPGIAGSAIVEDESWKRRQLSVLIAPMPSLRDYSSGVAASDAGFYNITGVNVYTLTPIREEKEEKGTNFL